MKDISTLVDDIYGVLEGHGGWNTAVAGHFNVAIDNLMDVRLNGDKRTGPGTIRMSNVAQPCARKLWYHVKGTPTTETLAPNTRMKFLYGDIIEEVLLSLAEAAGHKVVGRQDEMLVDGIKGHRDGVIDGMLVDVKSASTYSFKKFKEGKLKEEDPFGYIGQLSGYLLSSQDDPKVTNKKEAAFLVMDKQNGHVHLDVYNLEKEMEDIKKTIAYRKSMVEVSTPPSRGFSDEPFQKGGNRKLAVACSYCEHKNTCWPDLRTFVYSTGPVFLTKVVTPPKVYEVPK